MRRAASLAATLALAALLMGAGDSGRFDKLGHRMMCVCGCGQVLLECNHVGCTYSDKMRNQLTAGMQKGQSDQEILQSFVNEYGTVVLAAPPMAGFNWVAWLTPGIALILGFVVAVLVVKRWNRRAVAAAGAAEAEIAANPEMQRLEERVREETRL